MSRGVGHRHSSDPELLCLWCRLAAVALILPLSLGTSIYCRCKPAPRTPPQKKKKKKPPKKAAIKQTPLFCWAWAGGGGTHPSLGGAGALAWRG